MPPILATLPHDILSPILDFLSAIEIGYLLFSGDSTIVSRFYSQSIIKRFEYRPQRPENAFWPSLVSHLPGLLVLGIMMPKNYEHMPLTMKGDCSLPSSITEATLVYAQASDHLSTIFRSLPHLRLLDLDGMRAPFSPTLDIGTECQVLCLRSFSSNLVHFGRLTKINMPLYLHAREISSLPSTLISLSILSLLGVSSSTDESDMPTELDDVVFPPHLTLLHAQWRSASYKLLPKLPPTITELHMEVPHQTTTASFPHALRHLSLTDYNSLQRDHWHSFFQHLPTDLLTLELQSAQTVTLPADFDLPKSLTRLSLRQIHMCPSHFDALPPSLKYLACSIDRGLGTFTAPHLLRTIRFHNYTGHSILLDLSANHVISSISCPYHALTTSQNMTQWPPTLTKLTTSLPCFDPLSFFAALPSCLLKLDVKFDEAFRLEYEDETSHQPRLRELFRWPPLLRHLRIRGIKGHKLYPLPSSLTSFETDRNQRWDTSAVLSCLPTTTIHLVIPGLTLYDEDVPQIPPRIVSLDDAVLKLTIIGCMLLPRTLRVLGRFAEAMTAEMEDAISEWCSIKSPRKW